MKPTLCSHWKTCMHKACRAARKPQPTGFPVCTDCDEEYFPGTGDENGLCWHCANNVPREETQP